MAKQRFLTHLTIGFLSLCLLACSPQNRIQSVSAPAQSTTSSENTFRVQELTAGYLERKIREWAETGNGEAMRQEIEFARYKHPQLLIDIMLAHTDLYEIAAQMPEVLAYRQQSPSFDAFMDELAGITPEPTPIPTPIPTPVPDGAILVNTYTDNAQWISDVAIHASGNFVVVWESINQDGDSYGIYGQRYNAAGVPQGTEFQIHTATAGQQRLPQVAYDDAGNFLVVWTHYFNFNYGIYARRYNSSGQALGAPFALHTSSSAARHPALAMEPDGDFIVAWSDWNLDGSADGVAARRFDSQGTPLAPVFQVNNTTTLNQMNPSVAVNATGFVIAWSSQPDSGAYVRRYNSAGVAQGNEIFVGTTPINTDVYVALQSQGDFVVTRAHNQNLYAHRFDTSGIPQGGAIQLNNQSLGTALQHELTLAQNDGFIAVWENSGRAIARRFDSTGTALEQEFIVNPQGSASFFAFPVIAWANSGLVISWTAIDSSDRGVFAKQYPSQVIPPAE